MECEPHALWKGISSVALVHFLKSETYILSFQAPEITLSYDGCNQGKGHMMLRYKNTNAHSLYVAKQRAEQMYYVAEKELSVL